MLEQYREMAKRPGIAAEGRGDAAAGLTRAAKTVEGEYTFPSKHPSPSCGSGPWETRTRLT